MRMWDSGPSSPVLSMDRSRHTCHSLADHHDTHRGSCTGWHCLRGKACIRLPRNLRHIRCNHFLHTLGCRSIEHYWRTLRRMSRGQSIGRIGCTSDRSIHLDTYRMTILSSIHLMGCCGSGRSHSHRRHRSNGHGCCMEHNDHQGRLVCNLNRRHLRCSRRTVHLSAYRTLSSSLAVGPCSTRIETDTCYCSDHSHSLLGNES